MKFNCGPTVGQRIEKFLNNRKEKLSKWHKYFAWYPVRVSNNTCIWLGYVERKAKYYSYFVGIEKWEYREIQIKN